MLATLTKPRRVLLHERVDTNVAGRVDRENGVIRGVKIISRHSRNNREYTDAALDQAATLYEGVSVFIDHPSRRDAEADRGVRDKFGQLRGVRRASDGDVYGDLYFLKSHPLAEQVCETAERMPNLIGLSHNAAGRIVHRNGKNIVESIESVRSVDLVENPATTNGLFEAIGVDDVPTELTDLELAALDTLKDSTLSRAEKLQRLGKISDLMDEQAALLYPRDEPSSSDIGIPQMPSVTSDARGKPKLAEESFIDRLDGRNAESANRFVEQLTGRRPVDPSIERERKRHADFLNAIK